MRRNYFSSLAVGAMQPSQLALLREGEAEKYRRARRYFSSQVIKPVFSLKLQTSTELTGLTSLTDFTGLTTFKNPSSQLHNASTACFS
jgi:hypothetical protein